jgi:3-deoxy-7-phosphoheptulonate synthase
MVVLMRADATGDEVGAVAARLAASGGTAHRVAGRAACWVVEGGGAVPSDLDGMAGVARVVVPRHGHQLGSRDLRPGGSVVRVGGVSIGGGPAVVIAGPCAVESRTQALAAAGAIRAAGAHLLRGGAFKPRTSPYGFHGLAEEGLRILAEAREAHGLPVVTEVMSPEAVPLVASYADCLQIGARNMQNHSLLRAVGRSRRPVLLKRGMGATVAEWLMAAEYVLAEGNDQVILCERGIRTFETATRNTLDLNAVAAARELTHLPVIVDPSHGTGQAALVPPLALAALAAGADGLIIEVHPEPAAALVDGGQSLDPAQFAGMMAAARRVLAALDRAMWVSGAGETHTPQAAAE